MNKPMPRTERAMQAMAETASRLSGAQMVQAPEEERGDVEAKTKRLRVLVDHLREQDHPTAVIALDLGVSDPEVTGDLLGWINAALVDGYNCLMDEGRIEKDEVNVYGTVYSPESLDDE